MANQNVTMSKLKRAFQLLAANIPHREICGQLHMGRGVLAKYKKAADERNLSYADGSLRKADSKARRAEASPQSGGGLQCLITLWLPDYTFCVTLFV